MLDTGHARRSHQLQASTGWQTPLRRRALRDVLPSTLPAKAGTRSGASSRSGWWRRLLQGGGRADVQPAQAGSLSVLRRQSRRLMVPPLTGRRARQAGVLPAKAGSLSDAFLEGSDGAASYREVDTSWVWVIAHPPALCTALGERKTGLLHPGAQPHPAPLAIDFG